MRRQSEVNTAPLLSELTPCVPDGCARAIRMGTDYLIKESEARSFLFTGIQVAYFLPVDPSATPRFNKCADPRSIRKYVVFGVRQFKQEVCALHEIRVPATANHGQTMS